MANKLPKDIEKAKISLKAWWEEEMVEAGLSGSVTVEHGYIQDVSQEESLGRRFLNALSQENTLVCENLYTAAIPGAPWAMDVGVFITKEGKVSYMVYALSFPHKVNSALTFLVEEGKLKVYGKFEGEGADALNEDKDLVKLLYGSLSRAYGIWGGLVYMARPSFQLTPGENDTEVVVTTTLRGHLMISKKRLGLKNVIEGLKAIEMAACS